MKYYKRVDTNGNTTTVESYSHNQNVEGAIEITKEEFYSFITSLPTDTSQPPYFEPENPTFGIEQRVERIEEFLQEQFPPPP